MKRIFLDIETLPPDEEMRDKISRDVERELTSQAIPFDSEMLNKLADERFRDLALKPEYGRLLTIGLIIEQDDKILHHGLLGRSRSTKRFHLDEARTLQSFWNLMKGFDPGRDILIGHNILDFDLPFIRKRSIINRVKPSVNIYFARYRSQPIYDTMWEWNHWKHAIKLSELAEALGLRSSKIDGIDGSNVYDHFRAGRHDEIALYCIRDVELVREIYYKMSFLEAPLIMSYEARYSPILSLMKSFR